MSDITIHSVSPYDGDAAGAGWRAHVTVDENEYTVYLQLPHCVSSRHGFLDDTPFGAVDDPDEATYWLLEEIAECVETHLEAEGKL